MTGLLVGALGVVVGSGLASAHPGTSDWWTHMGSGGWMGGTLGWLWMLIWMLVPIGVRCV